MANFIRYLRSFEKKKNHNKYQEMSVFSLEIDNVEY